MFTWRGPEAAGNPIRSLHFRCIELLVARDEQAVVPSILVGILQLVDEALPVSFHPKVVGVVTPSRLAQVIDILDVMDAEVNA